jgi:putative ABC transport system permease protein
MIGLLIASIRRAQRRPLRTILTILEMGIGALAVTLAITLIQGRYEATVKPEVFRVVAGYQELNNSVTFPLFTSEDLGSIRKLVPDVVDLEIEKKLNQQAILEADGIRYKVVSASFVGASYLNVNPIELITGSFFVASDFSATSKPIVVAQSIAKTLFGTIDVLGKKISMGEAIYDGTVSNLISYQIIGIFKDPPSDLISNPPYIYAPLNSSISGGNKSSEIIARAKPGQLQQAEIQLLNAVLQTYKAQATVNGHRDAVYITTSQNQFGSQQAGLDPQVVLFSAFGIIILIVCSIGIFSITLVDVAERTREIGMRRALGATRGHIILEFLFDASLLAGFGAIIGVSLAIPMLPWIQNATGPFLFSKGLSFSPFLAFEVIILVLCVGVLLGLYPAILASRLRPIEALRES